MLAVDVTLKPGAKTLHLVAKMLPGSRILREFFHCDTTVRKETDLYLLVRPEYENIQKENNVPDNKYLDVFPVCYGARISSKGDSGPVDEGSVILQENLKVQGYECGDRVNGLNLAHCKLVVDELARFHATAVAIKMKKPEEFRETVLRAAATVVVGPDDFKRFEKPLENLPDYESLKDRITSALLTSKNKFQNSDPEPPCEPFATFTHQDVWVNNIMFHYGCYISKEIPKNLKFVDFQVTRYDSPAKDLLFFLYTFASLEVLSNHYDFLVRFYYESFIDFLRILACDSTAFTFELFLKEIEKSAEIELWHILFMVAWISVSKEAAVSTDDVKHEAVWKPVNVGQTFSSRLSKFISDVAFRNWI